jgi:hypothetical protein
MWEWKLIFALIVIVAYVIKHILSMQQENQPPVQGERVKPPPLPVQTAPSDEEVAQQRTELDRRIEEAVESGREVDEVRSVRRRPTPTAMPIPMPMPMPPVVKRPVPRYQPPAPPRKRPVPELGRKLPPVPPPPPPAPTVVAEPMPSTRAGKAIAITATPAPAKPATPVAHQLRELLKDRQTLRAALVLREILDRPLSRRRRPPLAG